MKRILPISLLLLSIIIVGCGQTFPSEKVLIPPQTCNVKSTPTGASIQCPDGSTTVITNGSNGTEGKDGKDGTPGSIITPIKLCANDSTSFPEYGFKLGTIIYAVYWDASKGAFWAKLTPGYYQSTNGTGCTFHVSADGTVY